MDRDLAIWNKKEAQLRDIYGDAGDIESRIQEEAAQVGKLLDSFDVKPLLDEELKRHRGAHSAARMGSVYVKEGEWAPLGDKDTFLHFYKDMRSKTPVLTPALMEKLLKSHSPIDYHYLQRFVEDISKYNEMVVFANVLGLISHEEMTKHLDNVGFIDTQSLIEGFRPIINQSNWRY